VENPGAPGPELAAGPRWARRPYAAPSAPRTHMRSAAGTYGGGGNHGRARGGRHRERGARARLHNAHAGQPGSMAPRHEKELKPPAGKPGGVRARGITLLCLRVAPCEEGSYTPTRRGVGVRSERARARNTRRRPRTSPPAWSSYVRTYCTCLTKMLGSTVGE